MFKNKKKIKALTDANVNLQNYITDMEVQYAKLSSKLQKYKIDYGYLLTVLYQTACEWTPDRDNNEDFKKFHTSCGHTYLAEASDEVYNYFALEEKTAFIYCPYCGRGVYIKKGDIANVDSD